MTARLCSKLILGKATFPALWTQKRHVCVPKAAMYDFHPHQFLQGLLVCTDGFAASPKRMLRAFREKGKKQPGRGRCSLEPWSDRCIATVIKHTKKKRVGDITRKGARGTGEKAKERLTSTKGWTELNTAFRERLNETFRERLASATRKCRHAAARMETLEEGMYLVGCTSNFCFPHHKWSKKAHVGCPTTPAMAAALTDHIWSIRERLWYKVAPASWADVTSAKPQRPCGCPDKQTKAQEPQPQRPRGRPPTSVLAEVLAEARRLATFTSE
jgi:hypothetical protein